MKIIETGRYILTEDFTVQGAWSIARLPSGSEIEITQVESEGHQVIGPELGDWHYHDIPCRPINADD